MGLVISQCDGDKFLVGGRTCEVQVNPEKGCRIVVSGQPFRWSEDEFTVQFKSGRYNVTIEVFKIHAFSVSLNITCDRRVKIVRI